jgi:hypothetical protein
MLRMLRRLVVVAVVAAGIAALVRQRRLGDGDHPSFASAAWPPFEPTSVPAAPAHTPPARWLPPVDGAPPEGYPVKANDASKIFHVPGGRFYDRTRAERCYADTVDAIADGYRAAKA